MFVPPFCPKVNVEILVDDQPLKEYDDINQRVSLTNTAIKYMEARPHAHFAVRVRVNEDIIFPTGDMRSEPRRRQNFRENSYRGRRALLA
jgi:hypothetical protein